MVMGGTNYGEIHWEKDLDKHAYGTMQIDKDGPGDR